MAVFFFHNKIKMEKVCLDCAGVYGSHVRPSRKLHVFKMLPLIFWCFSQGPFFMHFLGAAAAKASKIVPKRVALLPRVGTFFPNLVPLGATGAQNDAPGP